ncbi:MAG: PIN domain nuclease [Candidatus Poribacteria bacterium]|nr:PIN domain nuclease [Candidatus Poribacteria bacterium]
MIVVDSSVWIDYFNEVRTPATVYLDDPPDPRLIATGDLIVSEVLQGFRDDRDFADAEEILRTYTIYPMVTLELAIQSANNYRTLRRRGITIRKTIDCLIATFVIESGFRLLHSDRDFDPFEQYLDLNVLHPPT